MSRTTKLRVLWTIPWVALLIGGWALGVQTMWWYWPILSVLAVGHIMIAETQKRPR